MRLTQQQALLDDAALVQALIHGFTALADGAQPSNDNGRVGVAVSGGPDSMALLALAQAAWPGCIAAATVDHGLRRESAAEANIVARYCAKADIPHHILLPEQAISGNIQSQARQARYHVLQHWCAQNRCQWLMTAHHADDQLETMLMRLNRGSGVSGMAGIRARNDNVLRPLLSIGKAHLMAYCQRRAIPFVTDPSNSDARYDRARLRASLDDCDWLDANAAAQSAAALAQADTALRWAADQEAKRRFDWQDGVLCCDISGPDIPHDILRRIIILALQHVQPGLVPRGNALERLINALKTGQTVTQGNVLCAGDRPYWRFYPAPERFNSKDSRG